MARRTLFAGFVIPSLLCLLIASLGVGFATAAPAKINKKKNDPEEYLLSEFNDKRWCATCTLFAKSLQEAMLKHQPPKKYTVQQAAKFLKREDRIDDILEQAIKIALMDYVWVDVKDDGTGKPVASYWLYSDLKKRPFMKKETIDFIDAQHRTGGDAAMKHYITSVLLHEEGREDLLEYWIKSNQFVDLSILKLESLDQAYFSLAHHLCHPKPCPERPIPSSQFPFNVTAVQDTGDTYVIEDREPSKEDI
jgi:hypothetical protein